jgi:hypothetical protein
MKFTIEQIALCPADADAAIELLKELGLDEWVHDIVDAAGTVLGKAAKNQAALSFNYQASPSEGKALELEVLNYKDGRNWMMRNPASVSHLGMHCTLAELAEWRVKFQERGIPIVQEVFTESHTNPAIANSRRYKYVIFGARDILGVDLKFIVRYNVAE